MKRTTIWVTFKKIGYHCYPQAKTDPKLASVSYLGDVHRHLFGFRVEVEVFHDDREIEFHMFQKEISNLFEDSMNINGKSCEMLADEVCEYIDLKYGKTKKRFISVSVDEDGECGSTVVVS